MYAEAKPDSNYTTVCCKTCISYAVSKRGSRDAISGQGSDSTSEAVQYFAFVLEVLKTRFGVFPDPALQLSFNEGFNAPVPMPCIHEDNASLTSR